VKPFTTAILLGAGPFAGPTLIAILFILLQA